MDYERKENLNAVYPNEKRVNIPYFGDIKYTYKRTRKCFNNNLKSFLPRDDNVPF